MELAHILSLANDETSVGFEFIYIQGFVRQFSKPGMF